MARLFSLCLSVKHFEKDNLILYRLADKVADKLVKFNVFEQHHELDPAVRRPNNPYTSNERHRINELGIWEWDTELNSWAIKTAIPFYELSSSDDLILSDENDIRMRLKSGFSVSEYQNQNLLVKIGETEETYEVLVLDSSKIKVLNGIGKVNDAIHTLKKYSLDKVDFLITEKIANYSSLRYIYKPLELPMPNLEFEMSTFSDKFSLWLNKQLILKGLSRRERKNSKELFEEILDKADEIKDFFAQNGFNADNLEEKIEAVRLQIEDVLSEDNDYDVFCQRMIEGLPKLTEAYEMEVERNWRKIHQDECEIARQEISSLKKQKSEIDNGYKISRENFSLLLEEARSVKGKIEEMTVIQDELQTSVNTKIEDIRVNITDFFAETIVYQSLISPDRTIVAPVIDDYSKPNHIIQSLSGKLMGEAELINSTDEIIYFLAMNLETAGILEDVASSMAQYVTACLSYKIPLLLIGYGSKNVADAISVTFSGRTTDVITLTGACDDYEILSETILSCQSDLVLIENAIGYINEQLYMKLIKEITTKKLLFSVDFADQINFISKSILNYVNFLFLDDVSGRKKHREYNITILKGNVLIISKDSKGLRANIDAAHAISQLMSMSKIYTSFRAELLTTMDSYYKPSAMFSWLLFEVVPYMTSIGRNQEISNLIDSVGLKQEETNLLQRMVKRE